MSLWLRWSWRDLRARWVQVGAIAFIIAIGSGIYSGLTSTSEWRRASYDATFDQLRMYDLKVALAEGSYQPTGALEQTAQEIPDAGAIEAVDAQLVARTQVDASSDEQAVLVPGRLVGVDVHDDGPTVDRLEAVAGRSLEPSDAGAPVVAVDEHFADVYGLAPDATLTLSGDHEVRSVGRVLAPEYLLITGERGSFLAEANYAVIFTSLETAGGLVGQPGGANEVVVRLAPGTDTHAIRAQIEDAFAAAFPEVGVDVTTRDENRQYRYLYDDIEGDQQLYNIFAVLVLAGAAFAAFNLTGRIVEAQRREIGIGMALGTPPGRLAIRPLLVGVQIALLGVAFGVGVGLLVSTAMGSVLESFFPLPAWRFPFQPAVYVRGALLGLALPILATAYPVWRAVRVPPITAIQTGLRAAKGGGLAPWLGHLPIPGRSTAQLPLRNVARTPRRTVMTMLGIAAAIMVLIGVIGMVDSFLATIDEAERELLTGDDDRMAVTMDDFYPVDAPQVAELTESPLVAAAEPELQVPGAVHAGGTELELLVTLLDLDDEVWRPTLDHRVDVTGPGLALTPKAADDLGVSPGDRVTLRHPLRTGPSSFSFVEHEVTVLGIWTFPTRFLALMPADDASLMGLDGVTNRLSVEPADGVTPTEVQRSFFGDAGVASVQPVSAETQSLKRTMDELLDFLAVVQAAVLLLALLIAFNSTSINVDERAREHATMFAFGLRLRSVLRMSVVENFVLGVLGTLVGLLAGRLLLGWMVNYLLTDTVPDLGIVVDVSTSTLLTALALGVVAVALAPFLTIRKLRRMDIPSTLRVVE